jgi:acyl-CoA synthetase (AMP-forming)/AMP-acid ligase II
VQGDNRTGGGDPRETMVQVLRYRAEQEPDAEAFTFLEEDGEERPITYVELDARARAVAASIQRSGTEPGERALLVYPPGLDYVAALYGCLYAGVVAVPAYPPNPARLARTMPRLLAILRDARTGLALTTAAIEKVVGELLVQGSDRASARTLATDSETAGGGEDWDEPDLRPDDVALIQYTSGTTASPRGVMVSHANLRWDREFAEWTLALSKKARAVSWLPPYHDMGLIGHLLGAVFRGAPCTLMSPVTFIRRPLRWLDAISRHRGAVSGGPNLAFDICVRRIAPNERKALDLSTWEVAYTGSEPVQTATIDAFCEAFAECGFRREAFYPCYGLAEATLFVTGGERLTGVRTFHADRAALDDARRAEPARAGSRAKTVVGCGRAYRDSEVAIIDPDSGARLAEGEVGEIWVRGPSVAAGYWGRPEETEATFGYRAGDGTGPFLRTRDLGFVHDGELFVLGRVEELITVAGHNYHPLDIELACAGVAGLRRNRGAAFSLDRDGREGVVVVYEVRDEVLDHAAAIEGIRRSVLQSLDLELNAIALVRPRTIPKTTSGKTQRGVLRSRYEQGALETVAEWSLETHRDVSAATTHTSPEIKTSTPQEVGMSGYGRELAEEQ